MISKPALNQMSKYHQFANNVNRMRVDAINKQNGLVSAPVGDMLRSPHIMETPGDQLQTLSYDSPMKRSVVGGAF